MYFDSRLWALTAGMRSGMAGSVLLGLLALAAGIARFVFLGLLLAGVFRGAPWPELLPALLGTAAMVLLRALLDHCRTVQAHQSALKAQHLLRARLYDRIVELGPAWFADKRTGGVMLTVVDGVEQLETFFGQYLPQVAIALCAPFAIFAVIAFWDVPVALVLLGSALFALFAPALVHRLDRRASMARSRSLDAFGESFLDAMQGLPTLKAFGQGKTYGARLAEQARALSDNTFWVLSVTLLTRGMSDLGIALGAALALVLGAWRVMNGEMSVEALLIVLMAGTEIFRPLRDLRSVLHKGMLGQSAAHNVHALMDAKTSLPAVGDQPAGELAPTLEFDDVSFAYPGGRLAHDRLSFKVAAGERVGIVGPSGAGKSSLIRLLLRQHDPQRGTVRIGGRDVRDLAPADVLSHMAIVAQDTTLFYGTVESNLRLGKPQASDEDMMAAARAANAHEFIMSLPQGYDTPIGERGTQLSGGQRQRLAIARALLRDAPILILDEALSSVDAENESLIQQALDRLMQGRTTLILAHRLASVVGADRTLVLSGGRVVEEGDHQALMAQRGLYFQLMHEQAQGSADITAAPFNDADGLSTHRDSNASPAAHANAHAHANTSAHANALSQANTAAHADALAQTNTPAHDNASGHANTAALAAMHAHANTPDHSNTSTVSLQDADALTSPAPRDLDLDAARIGWRATLATLLHFVAPWRGTLVATIVLGVARVAAFIGVGVLSALIVASVRAGNDPTALIVAVLVMAPLAALFHWLESWLAHAMAYRLLGDMRVKLFDKLERLAPAYLMQRRTGDLVALSTQDVEMVEYFYAHTVAPAIVSILVPLTVLLALGLYSWPLALVLLPFLAYAMLSPLRGRRRIDALGSQARRTLGELSSHVTDTIQGLGELVALQATGRRRQAFLALTEQYGKQRLALQKDLSLQNALFEIATGWGGLAVAAVGAQQVAAGALPAGVLPLLILIAIATFLPVSEISQVSRQLADTIAATRRLHVVNNEPEPIVDGTLSLPAPTTGSAIAFKNVSFHYPGRSTLSLANIDIEVSPGSTAALVGPSGAGKSTLAALLLRFWDPVRGQVTVDGVPAPQLELDALRARVALVTQDTYLFNDTLQANIRLARPDASDADLQRALEQAALTAFVEQLPEGLNTRVGERGVQLSGGQRQRIAIARAFLKNAPVLLLDEATSHLDTLSEWQVRRALTDLMKGRTTLIIAHRLATIKNVDRIFVLKAGRLVEQGDHDTLMAQNGLYASLARMQAGA